MKVNWKKVGGVSLSILGSVFPAVKAVEEGVLAIKNAKTGQEKQDEAFELIKAARDLVLQVQGKHILDNPKVAAATRVVIDAVVTLQNVLAQEMPDPPAAPLP